MAFVVLGRAGLLLTAWRGSFASGIWVVVAACALSLVLNLATPSPGERALWAPVALVLTASSLIVALG
jgi:hypothetical protein